MATATGKVFWSPYVRVWGRNGGWPTANAVWLGCSAMMSEHADRTAGSSVNETGTTMLRAGPPSHVYAIRTLAEYAPGGPPAWGPSTTEPMVLQP